MKNLIKTFVFSFFFWNSLGFSQEPLVKILVFGDSGTGDQNQMKVAKAMEKVCKSAGCEYALMLGDNFYENGVNVVNDQQFMEKFETPYAPLKIPFYATLGNHDSRGETQAQVDYTKKSLWWKMPAKYYATIVGDVLLISINSNTYDITQKNFVEKTLRDSKAKWKIVFGHHPIYSYGLHGNTSTLVNNLLPLVCKYADLYAAGHEHDLQVLKAECGLPLLISGASAKLRETGFGAKSLWSSSQLGFTRLEIFADSLSIIMYSAKGEIVYESSFAKRSPTSSPNLPVLDITKQTNTYCPKGERTVGFQIKNSGDKYAKAMYCLKDEGLTENPAPVYVKVDGLPGNEYDVRCPEATPLVVGVKFTKSVDSHIVGIYCRQKGENSPDFPMPYYLPIAPNSGKIAELRCKTVNQSVTGIRYKDNLDDSIVGILCQ